MRWETVCVGDICEYSTSGGTPKTTVASYYEPPTIPWLKTKEVNYCRIYQTGSYISLEGLKNSSAKLIPENSVIVAMYGQGDTAGRVAINKVPISTNQACCNLIIDPQKADYEFVYYALTNLYEKLISLKNGGAQPNLNAQIIRGIEIPFPPLGTQNKIASILSAYDDLIENNQKQIKLLEEAAQRLYKEWFVDLRFPGYENTPIVDGVPEGWETSTVGSISDLKKETVLTSKIASDTPYIGLEHMPRVDFCLSNWETAEDVTSNKFRYAENDIIFGKIRPYFHKVGFTLNSGVVSTDSFVMVAKQNLWGLLLMTVFDKAFVDYTYKTCKEGAKMPRADWNQMEKYPVLIPEENVLQQFEEYIWTVTRRIKALALQNHALVEARDCLLPKLMSGEIEV